MARAQRVRVVVEGDLAKALIWEAHRRSQDARTLAKQIIQSSSAEILANWNQAHLAAVGGDGRPGAEAIRGLKEVLAKAYGPPKRTYARRRRARA